MHEKSNVVPLNEDGHTPQVVLNRTMTKAHLMQNVVIIMQWKPEYGGGTTLDWSKISLKDIVFSKAALEHRVACQIDDTFNIQADVYPDCIVEEIVQLANDDNDDAG